MTELEKRIRTYAFANNCDFDEAAFQVLSKIVKECQGARSYEGLYDKLFKEEEHD